MTKWAQQRIADAQKVAKRHEKQGREVLDMLVNKGCTCNPSITFQDAPDGSPILTTIQVSHSLGCPNQ